MLYTERVHFFRRYGVMLELVSITIEHYSSYSVKSFTLLFCC